MSNTTEKLICAIDPGLDGAIVILNGKEKPLFWVMPVVEVPKKGNSKARREIDLATVRAILIGTQPFYGPTSNDTSPRDCVDYVIMEKQQAMLKPVPMRCGRCDAIVTATSPQGIVSTFNNGRNVGLLEGLIAGLNIRYELVAPQSWQPKMLKGVAGANSKARAVVISQRLFPGVDFRKSKLARKPHEGVCDAVVIGEFGRRSLKGDPDYYVEDPDIGF